MQGTTLRGAVSGKVGGTGRWMRLWTDKSAAELVEFAVVAPLLMMVVFGMFWFGRAYNIYETITRAAREGAVYGSRPVCALCGAGCNRNFPCRDDIVNNAIVPALNAGHIQVADLLSNNLSPQFPNCYAGQQNQNQGACPVQGTGFLAPCENVQNRIWICRCVDMAPNKPAATSRACGIAVTMTYPWKFTLPFSSVSNVQFNIPATVQERQEF